MLRELVSVEFWIQPYFYFFIFGKPSMHFPLTIFIREITSREIGVSFNLRPTKIIPSYSELKCGELTCINWRWLRTHNGN